MEASAASPAGPGSPDTCPRWAMALPDDAVAIVREDRGVVTRIDAAGRQTVARFYAPDHGLLGPWRLEQRAWRAWTELTDRSAMWHVWRGWLGLAAWLAVAAVVGEATDLPWLAAAGVTLTLRLAPWLWQVARVAARRPSARQVAHAREHELTDRWGLDCGATWLMAATLLACVLEVGAAGLLGRGGWWAGAVALFAVRWAAGRGWRPPAWLGRLVAVGRA